LTFPNTPLKLPPNVELKLEGRRAVLSRSTEEAGLMPCDAGGMGVAAAGAAAHGAENTQ